MWLTDSTVVFWLTWQFLDRTDNWQKKKKTFPSLRHFISNVTSRLHSHKLPCDLGHNKKNLNSFYLNNGAHVHSEKVYSRINVLLGSWNFQLCIVKVQEPSQWSILVKSHYNKNTVSPSVHLRERKREYLECNI